MSWLVFGCLLPAGSYALLALTQRRGSCPRAHPVGAAQPVGPQGTSGPSDSLCHLSPMSVSPYHIVIGAIAVPRSATGVAP